MIYTEETLQLEQLTECLVKAISESAIFKELIFNKNKMLCDSEYIEKQAKFKEVKEKYEYIADYGEYAPDFSEYKKAVWRAKRELDLIESVVEFRQSETAMQSMLDDITYQIGSTVSSDIKVDAGNPFFEFASKGCGGCHVRK